MKRMSFVKAAIVLVLSLAYGGRAGATSIVNQALVGDVISTVAAENTTVEEGGSFSATYTATNGWISSVYTNGAPAHDCSAKPTEVTLTLDDIACDYHIVVATSAARPDADAWYVNPGLTADFAQVGATASDGCAGFHWGLDATDDFLAAPIHFTGQNSTLYPVKSLEAGGSSALGTYTANTLFSANVRGAAVSKPLNVHLVGSALDVGYILSLPLNTAAFGPNTNAFKIWTSNGTTPDAMTFTADGQYLYANGYKPDSVENYIYKYRVLNGLKSSGTNLQEVASWNAGVRVRQMIMARLGGKDIIYIQTSSGPLYMLDASSTGNTPVSLGVSSGSSYGGITVAGIGAGTPHLYCFNSSGLLQVFTIKGDYTVETTPYKSYTGAELGAICGYASVSGGGTGAAVAVTDDEATLFLGSNVTTPTLPDRMLVIRSVPTYNVNQALVGDVISTVAAENTTVDEGGSFSATYTATNGWISSVYTNGAPAHDCSAKPTEVTLTLDGVACDFNIVVATSAARPDADAWHVNPGLTADFAQVGATASDGCAGFHWGLDATDDFLAAPLHFTGQNSTLYPVKSLEAGGSSALGTYTANTLFSANVRGAAVSKPLNVHLVGSAVDAKSVLSLPLNTAAFGPNTNAFKIWTSNGTTPDAMRFTADGQHLYANAYAPSAGQNYIYKYRVLNGLKSSGTNLVLEATWTVGIRVRDMTVAHLDGKDIVYINANSALYVLDTSSTGNTPVSLGVSAGSNYAGLTVAGIGAGTPHLYSFRGDTGKLDVYTIKADFTVETTPFKSYTGAELGAICGYATVGAGGTGVAVAVPDDEATLFLGANVTGLPDRLLVIRSVPVSYPDWIMECGLEGEALTAMQGKYDTWAAWQTVDDLMTTDYSAPFLMNADATAAVALVITNITLDGVGNVTLAIKGTADDVTLDLAEINGVLYLSTATDLAGTWSGKTFGTVDANIGVDGIAVPVFASSNGLFFKAEVGYAAPDGSTELTSNFD